MSINNLIHLNQDNFDATIEKNDIVLLDFWGQQCAPCHSFSKTLEEVAPDYPQVVFAKINTDEEQQLAAEFSIRSIPFVMLMRERVVLYADSGALPTTVLRELLDDALKLDMAKVKADLEQADNEDGAVS